jgi:hypothetical protein
MFRICRNEGNLFTFMHLERSKDQVLGVVNRVSPNFGAISLLFVQRARERLKSRCVGSTVSLSLCVELESGARGQEVRIFQVPKLILPIPGGRRSSSDMCTCVVDNNISNEKRIGMPANLLPHNPHKTCNIRPTNS